jgi:hypothetical protein
MGTELQVRLTGLSAPGQLVDLAQTFPDLKSCWNACTSPEFMLWLSARLASTTEERRAVVSCLAELTRRAEHGRKHLDPPVERAAGTAEAWLRSGASLDELLAAERAALDAAATAALVVTEEGARARLLFQSAPRSRPASFGTSRALGALAEWREADHARRLALAAAGTVRAATEAARADTAQARYARASSVQAVPNQPGGADDTPAAGSWETSVSESAASVISALACSRPARRDDRAVRKAARLVRRRLPCPSFD